MAFLDISPGWFIAFGVVWLALLILVFAMACAAGRADELMEQKRHDELDRVGEWTSR